MSQGLWPLQEPTAEGPGWPRNALEPIALGQFPGPIGNKGQKVKASAVEFSRTTTNPAETGFWEQLCDSSKHLLTLSWF